MFFNKSSTRLMDMTLKTIRAIIQGRIEELTKNANGMSANERSVRISEAQRTLKILDQIEGN